MKHARIATHLFADGGRIIDSTRTDYSEHLGREDLTSVLRLMMKEQHKKMFVRLRAGDLDGRIEAACGPLPLPPADAQRPVEAAQRVSEPAVAHLSLPPAEDTSTPPLGSPLPLVPPAASSLAAPASTEGRSLTNPNLRRMVRSARPTGELELDVQRLSAPPGTAGVSLSTPSVVAGTSIGVSHAIHSAGLASKSVSSAVPRSGLGSGASGASGPSLAALAAPIAQVAPGAVTDAASAEANALVGDVSIPKRSGNSAPPAAQPEEGRYAVPRPSSIFGSVPPVSKSLFGEQLINEQTLDEVILSYLAEDLEGPSD